MKNRSYRYDINRTRFRQGHKYSTYKKYLTMIILICVKQHLTNIWRSIHTTLEAQLKKRVPFKKSVYFSNRRNICILYLCQKLYHLHWYVTKIALLLYNFRKTFHSTGLADSPSTGCRATKFELQTIFEKCFEISENFR